MCRTVYEIKHKHTKTIVKSGAKHSWITKNELDTLVKNGDLEEIKEVDQLKESTISKNPFKLKTLPNGEEVYYWCSKPE